MRLTATQRRELERLVARATESEIPYVICGKGGHNVTKLQAPRGVPLRTPQPIPSAGAGEDTVNFESYHDTGAINRPCCCRRLAWP